MELRRVNPKTIKVPEVRVTAQFDEELYERFKDSIKAVGQITPPICYEVEGEIILCDGLHRVQEAIANGDPEINVAVLPGDMIDVLSKNIFLDHLRGKTPVSDMVKVLKLLYEELGLDVDKVDERTGLGRKYIEKLLKIGQASPVVQQALDEGWIGVGVAFEISRLPHPLQQEEIIEKQRVYGFKVSDLKELVDKTLQEMELIKKQPAASASAEPKPAPVYHCEGCKQEIEQRYLRMVGLCPDCFGDVWRLGKTREAVEVKNEEDIPSP